MSLLVESLSKNLKIIIKLIFNPVILISLFGPALAYRTSLPFIITDNKLEQFLHEEYIGILDFQIQAYTVILGFTIAFLLFSKTIFSKTSGKTIYNVINEISEKTSYLMFYIFSILVFTTGFIIITLLMNNVEIIYHYINYQNNNLIRENTIHLPPLSSPLTLYRLLLIIYSIYFEFYIQEKH